MSLKSSIGEVSVEVITQTVVMVQIVAKEVVVIVANVIAVRISLVNGIILVSINDVSMAVMMAAMTTSMMKAVARQQWELALSPAEALRTTASVVTDAATSVETGKTPARRNDRGPELASRAEKSGVTSACAGRVASAVAVAPVGASRRRAPISGPSFRANAFMGRGASAAFESASAGTNRSQTLRSGVSFRTLTLIASDASSAVEARRSANRATIKARVKAERTSALTRTGASAAVKARRVALEVLASPPRISVGTNASDSLVSAESSVVAEQRASVSRRRLRRRRRRRFRRRFRRTKTGVALFGLSRRRPFLGGNAAVAFLYRDRRIRAKSFSNSSSTTASRRARRPGRPRQHRRRFRGGGRGGCCSSCCGCWRR